MQPSVYRRTIDELKARASLFWPAELTAREVSASIIPRLLQTQDKFISLLSLSDARPDAWKEALRATEELKANLFLKHLMVLSDMGGEPLKRLRSQFPTIFPTSIMHYVWRGNTYEYAFQSLLTCSTLDNKTLHVDGKSLVQGHDLDARIEDVIMLLLHGATINTSIPDMIREKCMIGSLMGNRPELEQFVRQRYIWVSRITGGATSNALGQIAQDYVRDILAQKLPDWRITRNGTVPGISHNQGRTDINFDLVARSPGDRYTAIEICFQVTTNSVIERKAGQAQSRAQLLHDGGHHIAYVLDGAGNFERQAALRTICEFSDCTVALTADEIDLLLQFLREHA